MFGIILPCFACAGFLNQKVLPLEDRLCGCALHKALDVPYFDKDSTVFHCLYLRRLWSWRKTFSSCLESAGLRLNMITHFYSPSLCQSPFFLCLSIFIPLLCFMSTPPHSPISLIPLFFFFFTPHSCNQLWPSLKKNCWVLPTGSVSCLPLVPLIPSALRSHPPSCLNSAQLTQNQYWFRDEYIYAGVGCYFWSSGPDTTLQCLNEVIPAVAEIRSKCIRYQMVRTLKIAHSSTQGCMFHALYW